MTAKEWLRASKIDVNNIVFVAYIDGSLRNPNIVYLMEEYAKLKQQEICTHNFAGKNKCIICGVASATD